MKFSPLNITVGILLIGIGALGTVLTAELLKNKRVTYTPPLFPTLEEFSRVSPHLRVLKTEVTEGQFSVFKNSSTPDSKNYPANVSLKEAVDYANWLQAKFRELKLISDTEILRLPTRAEWEIYSEDTDKNAGNLARVDAKPKRLSHYKTDKKQEKTYLEKIHKMQEIKSSTLPNIDNMDRWTDAAPVGQFKPNPHGLYDINGNVAEWLDKREEKPKTSEVAGTSFATTEEKDPKNTIVKHPVGPSYETVGFRLVIINL